MKVFLALSAVVVLVLAGAGNALAQEVPPIPADYSGDVYVGGAKAGAGLQVLAKIEDYTSASVTTDANGFYFFLVVGPPDVTYVGKTIHFYVNGVEANETSTFAGGSSYEDFALHIAALPPNGGGGGGGGGGGEPPPAYVETNLFGVEASFRISDEGEVGRTIEATSEDGKLTITIPEGTIALNKYGNPLYRLTANVDPSPPEPPEGANIIGLAYDFGRDGATFDPEMTLTWSYDPDALPEGVAEEDLVLAYYDEDVGEWVEFPCEVDRPPLTASVSHFTTFAIIAPAAPPEEEEIVLPPEEEEVVLPPEEEEIVLPAEEEEIVPEEEEIVPEEEEVVAPPEEEIVLPPEEEEVVVPAKEVNWPLIGGIIAAVVGFLIFFLVVRRRAY